MTKMFTKCILDNIIFELQSFEIAGGAGGRGKRGERGEQGKQREKNTFNYGAEAIGRRKGLPSYFFLLTSS